MALHPNSYHLIILNGELLRSTIVSPDFAVTGLCWGPSFSGCTSLISAGLEQDILMAVSDGFNYEGSQNGGEK